MSTIGPAGERGKTGDHGQRGDTGDIGDRGPTGRIGETGDQGTQGTQGRPGRIGDTGDIGVQGVQGETGKQGLRGRSLTWVQALAMFLLILLIGLIMAYTTERQQHRLEVQQADLARQQAEINANSRRIADARYKSCLGGVQIIEKFNKQMRTLADIERRSNSPVAKERIKAYEAGLTTLPVPACQR